MHEIWDNEQQPDWEQWTYRAIVRKLGMPIFALIKEGPMNILVLNGSPKTDNSRTLRLTEKFLEGMKEARPDCVVDCINLHDAHIQPCTGCGSCWKTNSGLCAIKDDAIAIHEHYLSADIIIWSFPLYIYGAPSQTKACMDRLVFPSLMPQMYFDKDGVVRHPWRFKGCHERQVLISTCGFPQIEHNYDALLAQMDIINHNITPILCCASAALQSPQFEAYKDRVNAYLEDVKQAGIEYVRNDGLSLPLINRLKEPLVPPDEYMKLFNAPWDWNFVDARQHGKQCADQAQAQPAAPQTAPKRKMKKTSQNPEPENEN